MPEFNPSLTLYTAATAYLAAGYNLIPLHTQADRAKHPAVAWRAWQSHKISQAELQHWFLELGFTGLGILTGRISGLVVLDFDNPNRYAAFVQLYPELARTYTVQSRRGPHLYFKLSDGLILRSRKGQGVDLLAEGRYVVAPPTAIDGHTYTVSHDQALQMLSPAAIHAIETFIDTPRKMHFPSAPSAQPTDLNRLYQHSLRKGQGRNNALLRAALHARDHGWSQPAVIQALADLHSQQPTPDQHRRESPQQRHAEARRTIASAFSRPARQLQPERGVSRYPNAVRETLLNQSDGAVTLRLIEGLRLAGLPAGSTFTEKQACMLLQGLLSRESIGKALKAHYPDGKCLFHPPDNPPAEADPDGPEDTTNKCTLSPGKNQANKKRGVIARRYTLPASEQMLAHLGLDCAYGDPLTLEDMGSSKAYRQALHRELIKRRPGPYGQTLLGDRLGVTDRSIRNYNKAIPIHSSPTWHEIPLSWSNLSRIPSAADVEIPTGGQCLLDDTGKKWPLKREIAAKLLKTGHKVSHLRRGPNYYWYGQQPQPDAPTAEMRLISAGETASPQIAPLQVLETAPECPVFASGGVSTAFYVPAGATPARGAVRPANRVARFYRSPLPDVEHEHLALWVHKDVPDLSLPNARRLVETYGLTPVEQSLKRLWVLVKKERLRNPAGFLITATRAAWARLHGSSAPVFHAQPVRKGPKTQVVPPEHDPLWQSETYQQWRRDFFPDLGGMGEGDLPY